YNGKPSLFGPGLTSQAVDPAVQAQQAQPADVSVPGAPVTPAAPATVSSVPGEQAPAVAQSENIDVRTNVMNLTFDTRGAQLIRIELPRYTIPKNGDEPFTLLDRRAGYTYVAQTGVVGAPAGQNWPTHLTPFRYVGQQQQGGRTDVSFEAESDDLRVV